MINDTAMDMQAALAGAAKAGTGWDAVQRSLDVIRTHLGMDVAYASEFVDDRSVFRAVEAPGLEALAKPGDSNSLDDVYCRHILEGRLPELIQDTADEPQAVSMPITKAVPIGSHLSVPIRMSDDSVYGMFCCLSAEPDRTLSERDHKMMQAFAKLAAFEIEADRENQTAETERRNRIAAVLETGPNMVFQPIMSVDSGEVCGFESLARFESDPYRTPDIWFHEAADVGAGAALELAAVRQALRGLDTLPENIYVTVNLSPKTVLHEDLASVLTDYPENRVVIEITEHAQIEDIALLSATIQRLQNQGYRVAVDDAGSGYSGLQTILAMKPDIIKLDRSLIENIHSDPARRALAAALTTFARETGSYLVAEGVETEAELAVLRPLGVHLAQGYLLGRPMPLTDALAICSHRDASQEQAMTA
ncbi:MAG: EAL domain-containing protein [Pacificimonas sp.]